MLSTPIQTRSAVDSLRAASSELKFDTKQIVIVSGEPHEGYEFTDQYTTGLPYRWAALGGIVGATLGYLLTTLTQKSYPDSHRRHVPHARVDQRHHRQ